MPTADVVVNRGWRRGWAAPWRWSDGLEPLVGGLQPLAVAAGVGLALALLVDDLRFGFRQEGRIAELRGKFGEVGVEAADLLAEPRLFLGEIDDLAKSEKERRSFDHHLD